MFDKYFSGTQSVHSCADSCNFYVYVLRALKNVVSPEIKNDFHLVSLENNISFKLSCLN